MKFKLGGIIVMVALSSAVLMLGYTQYVPPAKSPKPRAAVSPALPQERENASLPGKQSREGVKLPARPDGAVGIPPGAKPEASREVMLFVTRAKGDQLQLVPVRQRVGEATPLAALKALADYRGPEDSALPKGTKVLGLRVGNTGLAVADFSHEIVDNFPGGSRTEQLLLASIVNTLTQFRSVSRVAITVDGKPVESIGGHIDLEEPLTKEMGLVAPGEQG
ncbi:MAG: GerMN domain-containing protein [Armatimonadetes bacterium]|nr:GerMN domain-containing protein [Armatimonadota bacterium]